MFLQATIVPPRIVLEAIADVVQSADVPLPEPVAPPEPRRSRFSGRSAAVAEPPVEVSGFELIPVYRMNLPIAGFGNVTSGDAINLAAALKEGADRWATPTVRFAGAKVQEFPDRRYVVLMLDGEVDELMAVAREVTQCVQRRGFRFDRRKFLPLMTVAMIGQTTTPGQVTDFLKALDGFQGEPWTVGHFSVMKRSFDTTTMEAMEYQRILLGHH